jgi:hypothetical protein
MPLFSDLLITIKRKIKGKIDNRYDGLVETPCKKRGEVDVHTTASKKAPETGSDLVSLRQFGDTNNNISFNLLDTKQRLNSHMNLNFSVDMLPPADMAEVKFDEESEDLASIADKIDEL